MGLLSAPGDLPVRPLPGADRVLAHHDPPQPDLMCGPFAVRTALAALVEQPALPSLAELAHAAGTRVWPEDLPDARPDGAASTPAPFAGELPVAESGERGGTDAADLVGAVVTVTNRDVTAVPASGGTAEDLGRLLERLPALGPVGVVANLWTGRVGHFAVVWGLAEGEHGLQVALADSYLEVGEDGLPPACRLLPLSELHEALAGRGLLLLVRTSDVPVAAELVRAVGLTGAVWRR